MKIRSGFVSNSSSASYIIRIKDMQFKDFVDYLKPEYYWSFFDKDSLNAELKKNIQDTQDDLNKIQEDINKDSDKSLFVFFVDRNKKILKEYNDYLVQLDKPDLTDEDLVKLVLKYHGMTLTPKDDMVELSAFTSMHNSFNEGMPELTKEIVLYFMSLDKKVELEVERDS